MTSRLIYRVIWKELQTLIPIALVMSGLLIVLYLGMSSSSMVLRETKAWTVYLAYAVAALAGAAMGAVLFAQERESGTVRLLQTLPISGRSLATGKFLSSVLAGLIVAVVVWLMRGWLLGGTWVQSATLYRVILLGIEFFLWTTVCSLLLSSVLSALLWGSSVAALYALVVRAMDIPGSFGAMSQGELLREVVESWPRLVAIAALTAVILAYTTHWLHPSTGFRSVRFSRWRLRSSNAPCRWGPDPVRALIWSTFRLNGFLMLSVVAATLAALLLTVLITWAEEFMTSYNPRLLLLALAPSLLSGALVFHVDVAQGQGRILGQRGVPSSWVWWSRLAPWAIVQCSCYVATITFLIVLDNGKSLYGLLQGERGAAAYRLQHFEMMTFHRHWFLSLLAGALALWWNLFGVGAFCAAFFRNSMMAALATIVVGLAVGIWSTALVLVEAPWWTILPIGAGGLLGSYWLFTARVQEQGTLRARCFSCVVWLGITAASIAAFMGHRATALPIVPWSAILAPSTHLHPMAEIESRIAKLSLELRELSLSMVRPELYLDIRRASLDVQVLSDEQRAAFVAANEEVIARMTALSSEMEYVLQRAATVPAPQWIASQVKLLNAGIDPRIRHFDLQMLGKCEFQERLKDADLAGAWDALRRMWHLRRVAALLGGKTNDLAINSDCPWSGLDELISHPNQTAESLATLRHAIQPEFSYRLGWSSMQGSTMQIELGMAALSRPKQESSLAGLLFDWLPSERIRVQRWQELLAVYELSMHRRKPGSDWTRDDLRPEELQLVNAAHGWVQSTPNIKWQLTDAQANTFPINRWPLISLTRTEIELGRESKALRLREAMMIAKIALLEYRAMNGHDATTLDDLPPDVFPCESTEESMIHRLSYWPKGLPTLQHGPLDADSPASPVVRGPCLISTRTPLFMIQPGNARDPTTGSLVPLKGPADSDIVLVLALDRDSTDTQGHSFGFQMWQDQQTRNR